MPESLLIYGDRLNSRKLKKALSKNAGQQDEILLLGGPVIPETKLHNVTAYVDLENKAFDSPDFFLNLAGTFDNIRIVGIAEAIGEKRLYELARMGVSEILSQRDFESRLASNSEEKKETTKDNPESITKYGVSAILGGSPEISAVKELVRSLQNVDFPSATISGETGTGKDLLAKVLHYTGLRKGGPFIDVNCSAIPDQLFESELFGYQKGAFTDAKSDKSGLFEFADKGTIFLDEIGNFSLSAQAKLLKILENRKLRRLGSVDEQDINVRVTVATNINLEEAVASGKFREDLFYRLNLIAIHLPPLRERKDDIAEIAMQSFEYYCRLYNRENLSISQGALDILHDQDWPGNIRELRNVIERLVLLSPNKNITAAELRKVMFHSRGSANDKRQITLDIPEEGIALREIERQVACKILNLVGRNRSRAAEILGISRARLRRIMEDKRLTKDKKD